MRSCKRSNFKAQKSFCRSLRHVLVGNTWHLRMRNCWTAEIVNYLFFFFISTANIYELRGVAQFNIFPTEIP